MSCGNLSIGERGERLKMRIKQGSTFGPFLLEMKNEDGTPVNLTGKTIRGQIRKKPLDATVAATLACTITNAALGQYQIIIPAADTMLIVCGNKIEDDASKYCHDIELDNGDGTVTPLYYGDPGDVVVIANTTRP